MLETVAETSDPVISLPLLTSYYDLGQVM